MTERDDASEPIDQPQADSPDEEFDRALSSLEETEAKRRRRLMMYLGLIVAGIAALSAFFIFVGSEYVEGPIDVERSEKEALDKTDDPQCRETIDRVEEQAKRYFKLEDRVDEHLLGEEADDIEEVREEIASLREELEEAEDHSQDANLRFDRSRKELDDWFAFVDAELERLDELAAERLAKLKDDGQPAKDEGEDQAAEQAEADDKEAKKAEADDEKKAEADEEGEDSEDDRESIRERRDDLLVGLHDAFEKFRVWHTSAAHPCGEAEEGEEPWRPDEGAEEYERAGAS